MYSRVVTGALLGIESYLAVVEVDASNGMPGFEMVGMLNVEVREAKERVRVALKNTGISLQPLRVTVNISPAQFQAFQPVQSPLLQTENIDLLLDVPLEVTVELGRTSKSIKEILDFAPGTIVELNRLAGEPIDVLVNGKYVAKGEVVVIDEAFGIRVTEVIK